MVNTNTDKLKRDTAYSKTLGNININNKTATTAKIIFYKSNQL